MTKDKETPRINHIGQYLKTTLGSKTVKLSLDAGFTCPNRDGTCGTGGCIFCSPGGSGELAGDVFRQLELLADKWPRVSDYLVYFQSHTNTYAPVDVLREKYYGALHAFEGHEEKGRIRGIVIATRPDCFSPEIYDLLSELNEKTFMWVELGLQTIHGDHINRGYDLPVYDETVRQLRSRNIPFVTHLIMGLPGETKKQMEESVRYVCGGDPFGIKLHLLNIVRGSAMETLYEGYTPFSSPEEYISLIADMLEIIPPHITIHRLTGDVPRKLLIAPEWSYKKRTILNGIEKEMRRRGSCQGCRL